MEQLEAQFGLPTYAAAPAAAPAATDAPKDASSAA
jgi:hypothetical protein